MPSADCSRCSIIPLHIYCCAPQARVSDWNISPSTSSERRLGDLSWVIHPVCHQMSEAGPQSDLSLRSCVYLCFRPGCTLIDLSPPTASAVLHPHFSLSPYFITKFTSWFVFKGWFIAHKPFCADEFETLWGWVQFDKCPWTADSALSVMSSHLSSSVAGHTSAELLC